MSEIIILDSDRSKTVEVNVGDRIVIQLAENPTTGYHWELSRSENQHIELQGTDYQIASAPGTGGGGTRTFRLKAISTGIEQIQLRLRRSWESEDRAIEQFTVTLQIN